MIGQWGTKAHARNPLTAGCVGRSMASPGRVGERRPTDFPPAISAFFTIRVRFGVPPRCQERPCRGILCSWLVTCFTIGIIHMSAVLCSPPLKDTRARFVINRQSRRVEPVGIRSGGRWKRLTKRVRFGCCLPMWPLAPPRQSSPRWRFHDATRWLSNVDCFGGWLPSVWAAVGSVPSTIDSGWFGGLPLVDNRRLTQSLDGRSHRCGREVGWRHHR